MKRVMTSHLILISIVDNQKYCDPKFWYLFFASNLFSFTDMIMMVKSENLIYKRLLQLAECSMKTRNDLRPFEEEDGNRVSVLF